MNESNPYAPPKSPVSDVETPANTVVPGHVETACLLLWIALGIGVVKSLARSSWYPTISFGRPSLAGSVAAMLVGLGIGVLFTFWLTRKLRSRRNWMRWLVTVLVLANVATLAWLGHDYQEMFRLQGARLVFASTEFTQSLVYAAAAFLLHTRRSREWFEGAAR